MVRRMLGPKAVTASALAVEVGISQPTLSRWLRETSSVRAVEKKNDGKARNGPGPDAAPAGPQRRPQDWSTGEKLRAVVETASLEGAELGEYLRRNGLHREQLEAWRGSVTTALERPAASGGGRRTAAETKRIKELERELRRKEKALAETAALLVLRKKVEALWGAADDDTDGKNES